LIQKQIQNQNLQTEPELAKTVADAESESDADAVADAEPDEVTDEHGGSGGLKQRGSKRLFNSEQPSTILPVEPHPRARCRQE